MANFSNTLAAIRTYRGMTQEDLAEASGISKNAVGRYEAGINKPGADSVLKLAKAPRCSTDVLLGRAEFLPETVANGKEA